MTRIELMNTIDTFMADYYDYVSDAMVFGSAGGGISMTSNVFPVKWENIDRDNIFTMIVNYKSDNNDKGYENRKLFKLTSDGLFNSNEDRTFTRLFRTPSQVEEKLIKEVTDYLFTLNGICPPNILAILPSVSVDYIIDNYIEEYSNIEILEIYEKTDNEKFLGKDVKDIFLF